ncbi:MAG: hypothetical protein BWY25_01909 [Chloroflexi bacterium ADurb.Bin222]|nr:MAG: hypothetical protein BWY25_01909 [Chloroflexi bacterium ADurb.Bin222]
MAAMGTGVAVGTGVYVGVGEGPGVGVAVGVGVSVGVGEGATHGTLKSAKTCTSELRPSTVTVWAPAVTLLTSMVSVKLGSMAVLFSTLVLSKYTFTRLSFSQFAPVMVMV